MSPLNSHLMLQPGGHDRGGGRSKICCAPGVDRHDQAFPLDALPAHHPPRGDARSQGTGRDAGGHVPLQVRVRRDACIRARYTLDLKLEPLGCFHLKILGFPLHHNLHFQTFNPKPLLLERLYPKPKSPSPTPQTPGARKTEPESPTTTFHSRLAHTIHTTTFRPEGSQPSVPN
jgi:hypothetical protein